jgi:hypothetical protein
MWQAYVGIVSQRGLEVFCLEDPDTVRFLWRRVRRISGRAGCVWTVIAADDAARVHTALCQGQARAACEILLRSARDLGPLFPSDTEPADAPLLAITPKFLDSLGFLQRYAL